MNASAGVPEAILLSRLSKRLEDELGLAENIAKWAVETWALALGVIDQPLPVSVSAPVQPVSPVGQSPAKPVAVSTPAPSTGGQLRFPRFSVGKVKIGGKEQTAVGEINVPQGQTVALKIAEDVTEFAFLESCDPCVLITQLDLSGCSNFFDEGLVYLSKLINLHILDLSECTIRAHDFNEESWKSLKNLKNILSLNLIGCYKFQDDGLRYISQFTNLESLNLNMRSSFLGNIFITDDGLKHLGKLTHLKTLNISGFSKITGPGVLTHLGRMTHLESLNLTGCENVSASRIQELKQMLPNTRILP